VELGVQVAIAHALDYGICAGAGQALCRRLAGRAMGWAVVTLTSTEVLIRLARALAIDDGESRVASLGITRAVVARDHVGAAFFACVRVCFVLI